VAALVPGRLIYTELDHLEGNDQGELCVWSKLTRQHDFNSKQRSSLLNRDKSVTPGQKNGTNWRPGRPLIFCRDLRLKIGTVPANPGRMVTLVVQTDDGRNTVA